MANQDQNVTGWVGWIVGASFLLMFEGILQMIYGVAALLHQNWYVSVNSSTYVLNLATWGWISLALGVLLFSTGVLLQRGRMAGRMLGLLFVVLGAAYSLAFIAIAPIWSILALVVYALVGYAILAHGNEMETLTHA